MNDNEKMKIHLSMADQHYAMTIPRKDELLYRNSAKLINEKLNIYRKRHPEGTMVDHMTMVAFDLAFRITTQEEANDTLPYREKLEELIQEMEERFRNEQQGEETK